LITLGCLGMAWLLTSIGGFALTPTGGDILEENADEIAAAADRFRILVPLLAVAWVAIIVWLRRSSRLRWPLLAVTLAWFVIAWLVLSW
jgi:hypothetical protein